MSTEEVVCSREIRDRSDIAKREAGQQVDETEMSHSSQHYRLHP